MHISEHKQDHTNLINVEDCHLGYINTFTGILINLREPKPEDINIVDIAMGLKHVCRFGGQLHTHHGVDKHTLLVHHLAPERLKKAALLHDASEAYLGDVVKPLKIILGSVYTDLEDKFTRAIFERFNVNINLLEELKPYDLKALHLEDDYFRKNAPGLAFAFKEMHDPVALFDSGRSYRQLWTLLNKNFINIG